MEKIKLETIEYNNELTIKNISYKNETEILKPILIKSGSWKTNIYLKNNVINKIILYHTHHKNKFNINRVATISRNINENILIITDNNFLKENNNIWNNVIKMFNHINKYCILENKLIAFNIDNKYEFCNLKLAFDNKNFLVYIQIEFEYIQGNFVFFYK